MSKRQETWRKRRRAHRAKWIARREKWRALRKAKPFAWQGWRFKTADERTAFRARAERKLVDRERRHLAHLIARKIYVSAVARQMPPAKNAAKLFQHAAKLGAAFAALVPKSQLLGRFR